MKNLSITLKIFIYVSVLCLSGIFALGYLSINTADKILGESAFEHIKSVQSLKKLEIETWVQRRLDAIDALIEMPIINSAVDELGVKNQANFNTAALSAHFSSATYIKSYDYLNMILRNYMNANRLKNIMLIEPSDGYIYFSANKDYYFHTKLSQQSNTLSGLWKACLSSDATIISDMELDKQNNNTPIIFVGRRIIKDGNIIGVIIAQIDINRLNEILNNNEGLGETGESYIVGDDYYFRSDSRFSTESTTLTQKAKTKATENVFAGISGTNIIADYRGESVLSSYNKLEIPGLNWAILTEMDENEVMDPKSELINTILLIAIIIIIIMIPAIFLIGNSIRRPINMGVVFAKKLAEGDLNATIDINQKDEIGVLADALRDIGNKTKEVISSVMNATNNLTDAGFQLSSASQDISSGASEQASSVEEVSASMEEMASNIQQNADNANETKNITNAVSKQVSEGSETVFASVTSMKQIADKISIISDIAFQTNILALNASVEAARAGEYGKGFGVVASEVGKLADKTKAAASEINDISRESVEIAEKPRSLWLSLFQVFKTLQN